MSNVSIYVCVCVHIYIYTYTSHLYPFMCQWTFRWFPYFGYYKQCYYEHRSVCIFSNYIFVWIYALEWDCQIIWHFYFYFLRKFHTVFHNGCTNLHSHNSVRAFPFSTPSPAFIIKSLLKSRLFNDGHSDHWYLITVLICISLINSDNEHLFMCLLVIYVSSLKKYLFMSSLIF